MKKAIAGVLVVLGMFLTPGAAVAGLHESIRPGCFPLRSSGMFAYACCVTTRVAAGVGGGGLALWLGFQNSGKKKTNNHALDNNADVFHGNPGKKKRKFRKFTSPIRTALGAGITVAPGLGDHPRETLMRAITSPVGGSAD